MKNEMRFARSFRAILAVAGTTLALAMANGCIAGSEEGSAAPEAAPEKVSEASSAISSSGSSGGGVTCSCPAGEWVCTDAKDGGGRFVITYYAPPCETATYYTAEEVCNTNCDVACFVASAPCP